MNKNLGSLGIAHANRIEKLSMLSLRMGDLVESQDFWCDLKIFLM
jgi:hypothetical protein